ncbi:glycosyltransferase family 61 protein [Paragemmobacter straminiformis]|uniref:Glycosyltransferase family 61 protein n=1 Tax=Paragemmobacter straminiformis TaxID=2045119 RepID=A0A842IDI7_9RHOB|nr:glycosyltransferase 61 family protein [Gemmobacter straminiformis]MBC2837631.1 glycosyltransferase family 61 protein [Gemmobacter straminiformis]
MESGEQSEVEAILQKVEREPWRVQDSREKLNRALGRANQARLGDVFFDHYRRSNSGGKRLEETDALDWTRAAHVICPEVMQARPPPVCLTDDSPTALARPEYLSSKSKDFVVWEGTAGRYTFHYAYNTPWVMLESAAARPALRRISARGVDAINLKGGSEICKRKPPLVPRLVVAIDEFAGNNYCHWIMDTIPRLASMRQAGLDTAEYNYVFSRRLAPFQLRTLVLLGIKPHQCIQMDVNMQDEVVSIETDTVVSFSTVGMDFNHALNKGQPGLLEIVKDALSIPEVNRDTPKMIFVNRRGSRRLVPDEAASKLLERYQFAECFLEDFSFDEQVQMFRGADAVVASHGAGLTNILFCRPGTKVLEIFPQQYSTGAFAIAAHSNNLRYTCAVAERYGTHKGGHIRDNDHVLDGRVLDEWLSL